MKVMEIMLNYLQAVDLGDCLAVMLVLSFPVTLCLLFWFRAACVATKGRLLLTVLLLVLVGWGVVFCGTLIAPAAENGFAQVCAFFFGWAYPWIIGLPIIILALILRGLVALGGLIRRKVSGDEESSEELPRWPVVLFVIAIVAYSVFVSVKPRALWHDWGMRQYRSIIVEKIVHVQIRETDQVSDVKSCASCYHRYDIVPVTEDELLLKSSDIGDQYLRKVNGKWEWQ